MKRMTTRAETGMLYDIEQIIHKNTTEKDACALGTSEAAASNY